MDPMTRSADVARQYASTERLQTRRSVWGPGVEGVSPVDVLRQVVIDAAPTRVLEIGCGTGHFARSVLDAMTGVDYIATDLSAGMVEAAAALGVPAQVSAADRLPFADASFDVVVAGWMLYHVPDLDAVLREVRRVLRGGGTFAAATNGDAHLADLLTEAGAGPLRTQFSSENGAAALERHFTQVTRRDVDTRATFDSHAAAAAYVHTFDHESGEAVARLRRRPRVCRAHRGLLGPLRPGARRAMGDMSRLHKAAGARPRLAW